MVFFFAAIINRRLSRRSFQRDILRSLRATLLPGHHLAGQRLRCQKKIKKNTRIDMTQVNFFPLATPV